MDRAWQRKILTNQRAPVVATTETLGPDREIFDKYGASEFLRFSSRTMDAWIQKKRIPFIKLPGGSIRFRRSQLIEFLKKYEVSV
jgi:excisionase family DNA binding protein